jgi:hypothetical protein
MVQSTVTTARAGSQRGQTVTAAKPARLARPERTPQWTGEHAGELTPAVDRGRHGISALEQAWWDGTEHTRRRRLSHALHRAERVQRLCRREPEEVDVRTPSPRSVGCRRHGKCDGASAPDIRHVPRHRSPRTSSSSLVYTQLTLERSDCPHLAGGTTAPAQLEARSAPQPSRRWCDRASSRACRSAPGTRHTPGRSEPCS